MDGSVYIGRELSDPNCLVAYLEGDVVQAVKVVKFSNLPDIWPYTHFIQSWPGDFDR